MSEMPSLGRPPRRFLGGALALVAALGVGLVVVLLRARPAAPPAVTPVLVAVADGGAPGDGGAAPTAAAAVAPSQPPGASPSARGPRHVHAVIEGPLETSLVREVGRPLGLPLSQVTVRALAWWVRVPNDLQRGDTIDLLVEARAAEEPLLEAVRFRSGRMAKTFSAWRYQPAGEKQARFYQPGGDELELRLVDAPLDDYEQVTSLLRDGRGHKGVDFRTPVGTPVMAPFDGTISRRTWKFNLNGNSLELKEAGGEHRLALFLHLSEATAQVGATVKRGEVIGKSGNTGHSFAPHLHYQLMSAANLVLDPFQVQETERRTLPDGEKARFEAEMKRMEGMMGEAR